MRGERGQIPPAVAPEGRLALCSRYWLMEDLSVPTHDLESASRAMVTSVTWLLPSGLPNEQE